MKFFSGNRHIAGVTLGTAALLLTGIASALVQNAPTQAYQNGASAANHSVRTIAYTASGKTDRKTANLFRKLMQSKTPLQISIQVKRKSKPVNYGFRPSARRTVSRTPNISINYTIKGTTDIQTARKIKRLFQNSQHVKISAKANITLSPEILNRISQYQQHQNWSSNPPNQYKLAQNTHPYSGFRAVPAQNYQPAYYPYYPYYQGAYNRYNSHPNPAWNMNTPDYRMQTHRQALAYSANPVLVAGN